MNSTAQQITIHTGAETGMTGDLTVVAMTAREVSIAVAEADAIAVRAQ